MTQTHPSPTVPNVDGRLLRVDGFTLVDALVVVCVVAIVIGATAPSVLAGLDHARAKAASRYLAARMVAARTHAIGRGTAVALRFVALPDGTQIQAFVDGNRNGVLTRDIDAGIDTPLDHVVRLGDLFTGVAIGLSSSVDVTAPVQLGGTNLLSFTPSGTATSGSVYVRGQDGTQFVVRVLGATGRVRVLRAAPDGAWVEVL